MVWILEDGDERKTEQTIRCKLIDLIADSDRIKYEIAIQCLLNNCRTINLNSKLF